MQFVLRSMQSPRVAADDAEWRRVVRESFSSEVVPLSQVFDNIMVYCDPSDPLSVSDEHSSLFFSDNRLRHRGRTTVLRNENSTFKIQIPITAESTRSNFTRSQLARELRHNDFIIWNEFAMCHREFVHAVTLLPRDITGRNLPFRGKYHAVQKMTNFQFQGSKERSSLSECVRG